MKKKELNPTFKQHKSTGLSAVGAGIYIEVKIKGKQCAIISGGSAFKRQVDIQIAIKDSSDNGWSWIFFRNVLGDINGLKNKAKELINEVATKSELHFFDK